MLPDESFSSSEKSWPELRVHRTGQELHWRSPYAGASHLQSDLASCSTIGNNIKHSACFQTKQLILQLMTQWASQVLSSKEFACDTETKEMQLQSLGQEDPLEEVTANPPQCSRQENPMNREAWWATIHSGCKESDTAERLSTHTHTHTHTHSWHNSGNLVCHGSTLETLQGWGVGGGIQSKPSRAVLPFLCVLAASFLWQKDPSHRCSCCHGKGHSVQGDRNWVVSKWPSHQRKEVGNCGSRVCPCSQYILKMGGNCNLLLWNLEKHYIYPIWTRLSAT